MSHMPSTPAGTTPEPDDGGVPDAVVRGGAGDTGGWSWVWVVPILAAVLSVVLIVQSQRERGRTIRVQFDDGSGIEANDPVMYRGVQAGRVRAVTFAPDLNSVVVSVELRRDAENVAVEGSVFWVVRPEVSLTRVSGLETLVGPRYVQVEPGPASAALRSEFVGVGKPPTGMSSGGGSGVGGEGWKRRGEDTGQLHVVVRSPRLGAVSVGSPLFFRDVKVGVVTEYSLEGGAGAVLIGVRVEREYAGLVRTNSEFWNAGGVGVDFGFTTGLSLRGGSLESVLTGGIAFATPTKAGTRAAPGHVFTLSGSEPKNWAEWVPELGEGEGEGE